MDDILTIRTTLSLFPGKKGYNLASYSPILQYETEYNLQLPETERTLLVHFSIYQLIY